MTQFQRKFKRKRYPPGLGPRGPNPPVKQIALVYAALESGLATSLEIAAHLGISAKAAAARLSVLESDGRAERFGTTPRAFDGTRKSGGAIQWRVKGDSK